MAKKKPERSEEHELAVLTIKADLWKRAIALGPHAMWAVFWAFAVYKVAGHDTTVTAFIDAAMKLDIGQWGYLAVAGLCGGGWLVERKLKKREVAELSARVRAQEERLDPTRTSSRLNPHGERDENTVDVQAKQLKSGDSK